MGCVTSSDKSPETSLYSYHPREYLAKQQWNNCEKKKYEINSSEAPPLPSKRPISGSRTSLPVATKTTEILSVCDDFEEGCENENSCGYYSESISTPNSSSLSFDPNECDLKMEMYMMTKISRVMPKTSSPILPAKYPLRRIHGQMATNDLDAEQIVEQKRSYSKWKEHLQNTPAYFLNDVTRIPEAIAGQFSPKDFPAYTDLRICRRDNIRRKQAMESYII